MPEKKRTSVATAFWDTSAIVPLCCFQKTSSKARQMARTYGQQIVWWGTPIETISALNRLVREGYVSSKENTQSYVRLEYLRNRWNEIQPTDILREHAERLLRMHKLRAADALQLSAALTWCRNSPRKHAFIAADIALLEAAEAEGFIVISL